MVRISLVIAVAMMFALSACTAITDFDMPKGDLYVLSDNLPQTVTVTLGTDGTGTLTLSLVAPLPAADDAVLIALLEEGTVGIAVTNDVTLTSANLTAGDNVADVPNAAGEYALALDDARQVLTVTFFNATTDGSALHAGGDYTASFSIADDSNDYFAPENFTRSVTVE